MPLDDRNEVFSRLWQGSAPTTGEAVRTAGFSVLCVTAAEILTRPPYTEAQPFRGVQVLRIALADKWLTEEHRAAAEALAAHLATLHRAGHRLLVTCARGRNRSGLLTALTLCHRLGWSGAEALRQVQARRAGALSNPWFASYLLSRPGG